MPSKNKSTVSKDKEKRFNLTPDSTNLILLTSEKGQEIGEQFTMNLLGIPQQAINLPEEKKTAIFLLSIEIFKKLSKLANAVDKYAEEEKKLVEEFKTSIKKDGKRIAHHSDILEAAMEEVVGQAKSTLDIAAKIFEPLFGFRSHTFGEGGDKVINSLKRNTPAQEKDRVAVIIDVIEQFKPYLKPIIKSRTQTQHYENFQMTPLIAELDSEGKIVISLPKISVNQTASEFSEVVYHNIFVFIRDLLVSSFASKFHDGLVPVFIEEKGKRIKKIGVTIAENGQK